ncbi:MAG: hypothetical protein JXB06_04660 [Spirochaetales bacterium]|nr:hypothetical protein [Spirochaetales bacterium]
MEVELDGLRASLKIGNTFHWPSTLLSSSSVELRADRGDLSLRIRASREAGVQLVSPVRGEMRGRIEETLGSRITRP